jgi:hypothetical protein
MCKFNTKNNSRWIDPCMKPLMKWLKKQAYYNVVACCCGHGKYPMTIVVEYPGGYERDYVEVLSDTRIPRKKRFYKKDEMGTYYIPECVNVGSSDGGQND